MGSKFIGCGLILFCSLMTGRWAAAEDKVEFNREIRPILSDRCFQCHGPDEKTREANLRFDVADGDEGPFQVRDGSQAIKPKDPEASAMWQRLITDDEDLRMPPAASNKKPLTAQQKETIKRWILQGGEYEGFWSFIPPKQRRVPTVKNGEWSAQRIDQYVLARMEKQGLQPQPRADRRTLIRRVTFDLTGLPPTREEIHEFLNDQSEDAYEELIDRLMARPLYGEHMAKYWLDLVRFADTNGIHHDHYREMTPYRDWVIRSFNENLPFDEFVTYQIAGDLYDDPTLDQQIASGFNRLHMVIDVGTAIPLESFTRNIVDSVSAFGTAFLGVTLQCAVCHDHKYDPFTQQDFYQLFAFFNNIDAEPEAPQRGPYAPFLRLPTPDQAEQLADLEAKLSTVQDEVAQLKSQLEKVAKQAAGGPGPQLAQRRLSLNAKLKVKEKELTALQEEQKTLDQLIPVTLVSKEREEIRPAHILTRGVYDQPGRPVERNTPTVLHPLKSPGPVKTRMDLANWVTDPENPLTARVTVNRIWQQFFGVGFVKTSEDFGAQGQWPSHPDLLDDLALQFVRSGWDVKVLVKSIVMSETYRQSSMATPEAFQIDPENRRLARGSRFRMDSEMIRDQILAVSGLLNPTMYGKSVKPPQPQNLWKSVSMPSSTTYSFTADTGDKIYRRSVYSFWKRAIPPPQMTIFDAPTRESCTARRERTNTPLQALVLMNEEQYFKAAVNFAQQILAEPGQSEEQRLTNAFEAITSQLPEADELAAMQSGLEELRSTYRSDVQSAQELTSEIPLKSDQDRVELAAYSMLINTLFNLDATKTRE